MDKEGKIKGKKRKQRRKKKQTSRYWDFEHVASYRKCRAAKPMLREKKTQEDTVLIFRQGAQ